MTRLKMALAAIAACVATPLAAQTTAPSAAVPAVAGAPAVVPPAAAPAPIAAMVDTPCPLAEAPPPLLLKLTQAWLASPAERAGLFQSLTPEQRAEAGAMGAARQKKDAEWQTHDWPNLCKYKAQNPQVIALGRPDVVFMGDSITEFWQLADPTMFSEKVVDRGISGQTSPQMLARFMQDVVLLHPKAVHILAGTNDVAGNTGPNAPEDYENNIRAMVTLAKANGIAVILGSIPPVKRFAWRSDLKPGPQVVMLNKWLRDFAAENHLGYVDYYSALADEEGGLKADLSPDGVHPNRDGYQLMRPLAQAAIRKAK